MKILRVHHFTLAVRDADEAAATFAQLFGATLEQSGPVPAFGIRTTSVALGEDTLDLASPMSLEDPLARFLARKGEGFYNLALEVDDLYAAVAELQQKGVRVSEPVEAEPGIRSAFVAMASTHSLSIQLVELTREPDATAPEPPPATADATPAPQPEEQSPSPVPAAPLDLTPDEWSDVE